MYSLLPYGEGRAETLCHGLQVLKRECFTFNGTLSDGVWLTVTAFKMFSITISFQGEESRQVFLHSHHKDSPLLTQTGQMSDITAALKLQITIMHNSSAHDSPFQLTFAKIYISYTTIFQTQNVCLTLFLHTQNGACLLFVVNSFVACIEFSARFINLLVY